MTVPFKPVGIDENSKFPARVETRLGSHFGSVYNLRRAGLTDATTDIRPLLDSAVAAGARHILIPYRAAAWPMTTTWTANGITLEFEQGARISFDLKTRAMDLTGCRLINASFTSSFTGPASAADAADTGNYVYDARGVRLNNNCTVDGYYHENASAGLHVVGSNVTYRNVSFKNIRQRDGWGAAIHHDTTGARNIRGSGVRIENCDRGIETEDGAKDIRVEDGYQLNVYPNGYTGQPGGYATYTFVLDAHAHELGGGGPTNIHYAGSWVLENCGGGVSFVRSSGNNAADHPRNCRVDNLRIIGRAMTTGYESVALQGYNNHVERVHFEVGAGVATTFRIRGYAGGSSGNSVGTVTVETAAALPIIDDQGTGLILQDTDTDFVSTVGYDPGIAAVISAGGSQTWPGANQAILSRIRARRPMTIGKLIWIVGAQSGNYDIGIYDASGVLLWSKGATLVPAAGTTVTETVSPGVLIEQGREFFVAMSSDTGSAFTLKAAIMANVEVTKTLTGKGASVLATTSHPLPASIALGSAGTTARIPLVTVREV